MPELRVRPRHFDKTGATLYSSKELTFNNPDTATIITPIVGLDGAIIRETDDIAPVASGLNEIYHVYEEPEQLQIIKQTNLDGKITPKTLKRKPFTRLPLSTLVNDAIKIQKLNDTLQRHVSRLSGPTIFFSEYKGKRYPNALEMNLLLLTEHTFSDMPCLPITPNIVDAINERTQSFDKYLTFMKDSIDWLKKARKKPIMGIIPAFTLSNIDRLIKLYLKEEINAFCIDFDCRIPTARKLILAQCYRSLDERAEDSFFYGINIHEGRFIHNKTVINAKDILTFGFGIDAFGRRHRAPPFPSKEQQEKLGSKWKQLDRKQNKVRLFIKTEYGYYRVQNKGEIKNYPVDSKIPMETFTESLDCVDEKVKHCQRIFNIEQLGIEASKLRAIIEKDVPVKYLDAKTHTDKKDIEQMKKFKEDVKDQKSIGELL